MNILVEGYIWSPPVVGIMIHNGNDEKIEVEWIHMEWPPENLKHHKFDLGGSTIWDDGNPFPPTMVFDEDLKGNRYIEQFSSSPLVGLFETVFSGFYMMEVGFTNGCAVYAYP
jgi:hypothetical protein